jgi:hypothetical protein
MENMEMKNLVWSIYEVGVDGNYEIPSNKVEVVFNGDYIPVDGLYPFYSIYGLVGKVRIKDGRVDLQHLDKQIPKTYQYRNNHHFVEMMVMNHYGLIEMWLGS